MNIDFLSYQSVISAIKKYRLAFNFETLLTPNITKPYYLKIIYSVDKGSKCYYNILTNGNASINCCRKWEQKLGLGIRWKQVFMKIHKIQETKLKWMQVRIVHRILATNVILKEMGVQMNNMCTFCQIERDSIDHVFWKCNFATLFWNGLENIINEKCDHAANFKFTEKLVLFGIDDNVRTDDILDFIIILAKSFMYACKVNDRIPTHLNFLTQLKSRYDLEEYNARLTMNMVSFRNSWVYYLPIINS